LFRLALSTLIHQSPDLTTNLTFESWLSSLKLARMAALSFCTTALSSAMVLEARTLRMNCLTEWFFSPSAFSWCGGRGILTGTHAAVLWRATVVGCQIEGSALDGYWMRLLRCPHHHALILLPGNMRDCSDNCRPFVVSWCCSCCPITS
jgi:hypothetical protein